LEPRNILDEERMQAIQLIQEFYTLVNRLELDPIFGVRPGAARKMTDLYLKLQGSGKVYFRGVFEEKKLCSLLVGRIEERPHLKEERTLYLDLAVTRRGKKKKGYMKVLLSDAEDWCRAKGIPTMELRALLGNKEAISFWNQSRFEPFYLRYRKIVQEKST